MMTYIENVSAIKTMPLNAVLTITYDLQQLAFQRCIFMLNILLNRGNQPQQTVNMWLALLGRAVQFKP